MPSETLSTVLTGDASSLVRAFKETAGAAATASAAAKELSDKLTLQGKTALASADTTVALARTDKILRDATLELAVAEGKLTRSTVDSYLAFKVAGEELGRTARKADEAAVQIELAGEATKNAGKSAAGAGLSFASLGQAAMPALIGAGVALSPVLATVGLGLGGLALAAAGAGTKSAQFKQEIAPLKADIAAFQAELRPEVLTLFGQAAGVASGFLKQLEPVAAATGKGLEGVLGQIGQAFRSDEWQNFFGFMAKTAAPDIQLIGQLFVDLLNDLPPLLEQLQPLAVALLTVTDDAAKLTGITAQLGAGFNGTAQAASDLQATFQQEHSGGILDKILGWVKGAGQFQSIAEGAQPPATGLADAVGKIGDSAASAWFGMDKLVRTITPAPAKVGTLAGDMALLNAAIVSGNSQLAAYVDEWQKFVGTAVSDQQAVLNVSQAFDSYNQTAANSKKSSTQVQLAFLSIFTTIGTGLDTLHKNNASVSQVNDLYKTSISRLQALHGLTPQQQQDIKGLVADYNAWATSAQGLDKNVRAAANTIASNFITELQAIHHWSPQVSADTGAFADAILKTGDKSTATAGARAQLIKDLEKAGLDAKGAKALVDSLQGSIDQLHGKTVGVDVTASGSGGIKLTGPGTSGKEWDLKHAAAGLFVTGGTPGVDSVPILAQRGELVVPRPLVEGGAVEHLRGKIPGFASGGLVGMPPWAADNLAGLAGPALGGSVASALASLVKAAQAAGPAAGLPGPAGGSPAAAAAYARSVMGNWGWGQVFWPSVNYVAMRESGWDIHARNPSSGAYGIAQGITGPSWYYQWPGGNPNTIAGQVTGFFDYIAQRYVTPLNAATHEAAFNWYDNGGLLQPGLTLAYNGTGRPEQVIPPGGGGSTYNITVNVTPTPLARPADIGREVVGAIRAFEKGSGKGWRS